MLAELPKTGQTTSYAPGDDGDLQRGVAWPIPRFTNVDGTTPITSSVVVDQLTGLMWTREGNTPTACNGAVAINWYYALDFIACLNAQGYLGYADWRMPNLNEILTLRNAEYSSQSSWLHSQGFSNVQEDPYWTSTTSEAGYYEYVLIFQMYDGRNSMGGKTIQNRARLWPVRGGQ